MRFLNMWLEIAAFLLAGLLAAAAFIAGMVYIHHLFGDVVIAIVAFILMVTAIAYLRYTMD